MSSDASFPSVIPRKPWWRRNVLSREGLVTLRNYKYQSGGYSAFDNLMNPFWEFVVSLLPLWLAPNLVTLIGTTFLVVMFGSMAYFSDNLHADAPAAASIGAGFCLWVYNTLDAIDGKQARRTGASSPLGQLFDHGCDALGTILITMPLVSILQLGPTLYAFAFVSLTIGNFLLAQWEEFATHRIRTNVPGVGGVTEGTYVIIALFILDGFVEPSFWTTPFVWSLSPSLAFTYFFLCVSSWAAFCFLSNVVVTKKQPGALIMLAPVLLVIASATYLIGTAATVVTDQPLLYFVSIGMSLTYMATQITVHGMCRLPFSQMQPAAYIHAAIVANEVLGVAPQSLLLTVGTAYILVTYLWWVFSAVDQITSFLGIRCLSIKRRV